MSPFCIQKGLLRDSPLPPPTPRGIQTTSRSFTPHLQTLRSEMPPPWRPCCILLVSGATPKPLLPPTCPENCSSPLSFTVWESLLGLGPSSSCSLRPGLLSVSIGSSLKLGDSRAVSRGKGSSKSTSVPRPWFVTWEPTHITHHHNRAREEGKLVQNSEGKPSTENHWQSLWTHQERRMVYTKTKLF